MPKRKRSPSSTLPSDPAARRKQQCSQCINAAQKPLLSALRLGAGFERQKHSRRKKTAQSSNDVKALERLEIEYGVLKALNLEQLADQHLRRTLGRVKSLKDREELKEYIAGVREASKDPATLNVTARLYKVDAVKKCVDSVVEQLKDLLGDGEGVPKRKNDKKPEKGDNRQEEDEDEEMPDADGDDEDDEALFTALNARIAAPSSGEEDSEVSISDDERPPSIGDSESEHDPDADLEAADSDDESDSFEGFSSTSMEDTRLAPPSDLSSDNESDASESPLAIPKSKVKAIDTKPSDSTFLPALSHAAYISGSESEASDLDEAPRKNRRGQRARQKLAEKKYGAKAKHLEKQARKQGWDAKRGAVDTNPRDKRAARAGRTGGRGPQQSGGNSEPLGERKGAAGKKEGSGTSGNKRDDKGALHPSWQAAKMAKESKKLKIDTKGQGAAGKKVVFD